MVFSCAVVKNFFEEKVKLVLSIRKLLQIVPYPSAFRRQQLGSIQIPRTGRGLGIPLLDALILVFLTVQGLFPFFVNFTSDHSRSDEGSKEKGPLVRSSPNIAEEKKATEQTVQTTCLDTGGQSEDAILCPNNRSNATVITLLQMLVAEGSTSRNVM